MYTSCTHEAAAPRLFYLRLVQRCTHADAEVASGKSFMDLKAEPAVADTDGFTKQAAAGSPSIKGGQGGLREAVSPTRDRMAQALR